MPRAKVERAEFGPAFDDEVMRDIEGVAGGSGIGQKRRLALTICARSSDNARALVDLGGESYNHALQSLKAFEQHIADLHRIAKSAVARLKLVAPTPVKPARKGASHG